MEAVLELKAEEGSQEENAGQNHALANEGPVVAVPAQPVKPSKGQDPLWETLGRQLLEYEEMAALQSPEEQRRRLLDLLPVFLKAWEQSAGEISFLNAQLLASETSKLLVKEIQKNLNRKPAEEARLAVQRFLQQETGEAADGPVLFRSVYLLSLRHLEPGVRCSIIQSGLPVLLLQCLHLFFVSPLDEAGGNGGKTQDERQTRDLFVQTMLNICAEEPGVEELLLAADLRSLIISVTSLWDQSSPSWKCPTSQVLRTISKAQSKNIISYLQATDCIKVSIQNLSSLAESLPPCEVCEPLNIILCFVKNSYPTSSNLLLEFEKNGGYQLMLDIFLRYDGPLDSKEHAPPRESLDFLTQLTMCGNTELQVSGNIASPQLPQFEAKQSTSSGNRVRNLKAFQVLESLFRKSINPELCRYILRALKSIWTWDSMNFFLLEWSLQPISQFVSLIPHKPPLVQKDFFQLVESVVWDLSYIPHEILKEIQRLIKENANPLSTSAALLCLHSITRKDQLFKELFRDSGLLGMLLAQLRKEAKILRKKGGTPAVSQDQRMGKELMEKELVNTMLQMVVALVVGSVRNTVVFRDYGMVPYIKIFIDDDLFRSHTLTILEQLSVINPEEYMSIIVGDLCSSTPGELHFKLDLLKSLLRTMESPRGRSAFRTSTGFNGVLSLLADMEGALRDPPAGLWASFEHDHVMQLVLHILHVIAAALHLDPVNSDFFRKNGLFEKMADELGLLGCFLAQKGLRAPVSLSKPRTFAEFLHTAVCSPELLPTWLRSCIRIISFLDSMAKRNPFHLSGFLEDTGPGAHQLPVRLQEAKQKEEEPEVYCECVGSNEAAANRWPELKDRPHNEDWVIVCPGALCVMVRLIAKLHKEDSPELSWEIQYAVADHVQSLMSLEKSRQVACGAGLLDTLVVSCLDELHNTDSPLHLPLIRLFEKLASQSVEPAVLRQFLFLQTAPLPEVSTPRVSPSTPSTNCQSGPSQASRQEGAAAAVPSGSTNLRHACPDSGTPWLYSSSAAALQAAICLLSMTTPRSLQHEGSCLPPSFVEFDMSREGYGYLFLPTLATVLGPNTECYISGGTGKGSREFPPRDGLTFCSWFLVSRMGSAHQAHPLRFLTLARHMARTEEEFVCFAVSFSPTDCCLTISTEEVLCQPLGKMPSNIMCHPIGNVCDGAMRKVITCGRGQLHGFRPETIPSRKAYIKWRRIAATVKSHIQGKVQFRCSELLVTGQWHHLVVTVAKEAKRICTTSAYINGRLVGSAKMQYIQPLPGGFVSMDPSSFVDVYGYVATPPIWKARSSLTWRQGPLYFLEEVISMDALLLMVKLGPRYCSNFQAVELRASLPGGAGVPLHARTVTLVSQENISFGISVMSSSYTTVKDIRDCYGEVDGRLIAKELGLSSRDGTTPVFLEQNTAGKLPGTLRTIGAVTVGQDGTRVFQSCPAAVSLNYIGGPAVLLGLLAVACDDHAVYAAIKVLHSVLSSSAMSENLMKHIGGYQMLAYLLKKKTHLLNSRILQLVLSMGGIVETSLESPTIKNSEVFRHIICDFEIWCHAPENLDLCLFTYLTEILKSTAPGSWNAKVVSWTEVVPKLLLLFSDPEITCSRISRICAVLSRLLQRCFRITDILWTSLFLVYTLYPSSVDENQICLHKTPEAPGDNSSQASGKMIWLRNQLLNVLLDVMRSDECHVLSEIQEDVFLCMGHDWFLMFIQGHVHSSSVVLAVKLLFFFLHNRTLLQKFRESMTASTWFGSSRMGLDILMDNLKNGSQKPESSLYKKSGFVALKTLLSNCIQSPEVYFHLSALLMATPGSEPPVGIQPNLDSMLQWLLHNHHKDAVSRLGLCPEAAVLLLEMVKSILKQIPGGPEDSWEITYPGHIMQFFCLVYHRYSQDALWCNPDFLQALALVVFPSVEPQGSRESNLSTSPSDLAAALHSEGATGPSLSPSLHPARKQVWDFIRLLLMETLLLGSANKPWHPLELFLEASAENSTNEQKKFFQTEVLLSIMDIFHIIGQDDRETSNLRGEGDSRGAAEAVTPLRLVNLSCFTQKLVEKLCGGMLAADPRKVILFLTEQVTMVKEKLHNEAILSILHNSLNRAILYYLSSSPSDQQKLLRVLHTLQLQQDVIFAIVNSSLDFITCLLYCLVQIQAMSFPEDHTEKERPAFGHEIFLDPSKEGKKMDYLFPIRNVQQDILKTTEEIWIQLLSQRREDLEDAYKVPFSVETAGGDETVKMADVNPLWREILEKAWQHFLASEKKIPQNKIPAQASNKISYWNGSLSSAVKLPSSKNATQMESNLKDVASCLEKNRRSGQELYAVLCKDYAEKLLCARNKAAAAWTEAEEQLFGRGDGGSTTQAPSASRWVLDGYEGPARMRKRIRLNIPHQDLQTHTSGFGLAPEESQEEPIPHAEEQGMDSGQLTFFPALHESFNSEEFLEVCTERRIVLQEFAPDEKIKRRDSVVIVQEQTSSEGVLLFGQKHFYLCSHFTLSHLGEVYCTRHCISRISDSFIHGLCHKDQAVGQPACSRYAYSDIREILPMRFLLQEDALEIFFRNGYSAFLVFFNSDRTRILKRFSSSMKPVLKSKSITDESINIRCSGKEKAMLLKWQRREISNFDYLMYLNTLAGRTYSDLMQYPVFPWVLADYHSKTLDLTNPSTFRDLSKPMGAQTEERKNKFIQRYKEVEKSEGNLSAQCHYCTHYSSSMIVASYLVRIEPFTQTFRSLQGGSFDLADRMFHSVKSTWESASRDNMTDVRELIPEFFYFPEFLTNCNQFEFGSLQDGSSLDDVQLPPWAEGNPHKFISMHRQALESDHVSTHLHHWIDLIFGFKQHGPAAGKAVNIFHPYFYCDQAHLDKVNDPLIKSTILGFVSNFGQIPKQIFTKPHPARNAPGKHLMRKDNLPFPHPTGHLPPSLSSLHHLKCSPVTLKEALGGPVGHIVCTEKGVLAAGKNSILLPPCWTRMFCWGFNDFTCCLASSGPDKKMTVSEATVDWAGCLCAVCPGPTLLITSGSSSVICAWELSVDKDRLACLSLKQLLFGHTRPVTCLAASASYSILVSGSADRSCLVWDLNRLTRITRLPAHKACLSAVAINDSTGDIASCAGGTLYLWNINGQSLAEVCATLSAGVHISCCCFSQVKDWDVRSLVVTGDTAGNVQVWLSANNLPACQDEDLERQADAGTKGGKPFVLSRELDLNMASSERRSKTMPAITALAVSRNYSRILAGNEHGQIYCWSIDE